MRHAFPVTLLLAAAVLAGCAGDPAPDDPPTSAECIEQGLILDESAEGGPACVEPPFDVRGFEDPQHHCVVTKQRDRVHAPDLVGDPWVLGQYWDYALAIDGVDRGTTRLVYYEAQDIVRGVAQHYMVGTVTREEALRHAVHSENPVIGRVHRILYSPHEAGDHADMFHFPLCTGSQWTTTFYGERFSLTAANATLELPDGTDDGFVIAGRSAMGSTLRLSYSPEAQWFTFIELVRSDGSRVDMRLMGLGDGHSGPAHFLRGQQDTLVEPAGDVPLLRETPVERPAGDEGPYDTIGVAVNVSFAGQGRYEVQLVDPNGTVQWGAELGVVTGETGVQAIVEVPFVAGTWTLRETAVPPAAPTGQVRVVSIYDRSGSV